MVAKPFKPIPRFAVSVQEACEILSVSRSTIYRLLAKGDLRANKIGKRIVIPVRNLEVYFHSRPLAAISEGLK